MSPEIGVGGRRVVAPPARNRHRCPVREVVEKMAERAVPMTCCGGMPTSPDGQIDQGMRADAPVSAVACQNTRHRVQAGLLPAVRIAPLGLGERMRGMPLTP